MAYMYQEKKAELAPAIKAALKKYGMKGSIKIEHYSTLAVTVQSGPLFEELPNDREYLQLSALIGLDQFDGEERQFLEELGRAMMRGNHDNSDVMTDYFDVGWYARIYLGTFAKPYKHLSPTKAAAA